MTYTKTIWEDETPASTPVKYCLRDSGGNILYDDVTIEVITSIVAGTPINATNLNKLETGVKDNADDIAALAASTSGSISDINDDLAQTIPAIFTAKGQIPVSVSNGVGGLLDVGNEYNLMTILGGTPVYRPLSNILQIGASAGISTSTTSTSYIDVPNSSFTLTIPRPSTVILMLPFTGAVTTSGSDYTFMNIKLFHGATAGQEKLCYLPGEYKPTQQFIMDIFTGVAAGSVTFKAQFQSDAGKAVNMYNAKLYALVIPTA